jgi:hypothetical protein
MAVRASTAEWKGSLGEDSGTMKVGETGCEGPFTYASRFESGPGRSRKSRSAQPRRLFFDVSLGRSDLGRDRCWS